MVCSSLIWLSNWVSSSSVMEYVEAQETCGKDNNKHSNKHQVLFSMIPTLFLQITRVKRSTPDKMPNR